MKVKIRFTWWLLFVSAFLIGVPSVQAQTVTVSGQVTSVNGESLPGVNILVVGQSTGTVTDADGRYQINVSSSGTLRFSYIGFETLDVPVQGRTTLDVILQESTALLDEVIVMGYTTVSKRQVSSSVAQVSGEVLQQAATHDPVTALEGRMAGVIIAQSSGRPGIDADITIRGTGSIGAGTSPLYVVDGVIGGSGTVSPSDIESITVLKDAAATALYGSRAANGVVVITTKRGRPGDTQVNVRSARGYNYTMHGNERWMNAQELYDFHQTFGNAENGPFYNRPDVTKIDTNWRDIGFGTGITQMYEASVSGGSNQTTFYISGNFFQEEGTNIGTNYERISGRVNLQHDISENLNVAVQFAGNYGIRDNVVTGNPYDILVFSSRALPWDTPWNEDGTVRKGTESDWYSRDSENPLHGMQWNTDQNKSSNYAGDVRLRYNLSNWITFTSSNRFTQEDGRREIYLDARSLAGGARNGSLDYRGSRSTSVITSNLLHLNKGWETQSLSGLVGFEFSSSRSESNNVVGAGLAPGMKVLSAAAVPFSTSGGINESAFTSIFAQAEYEYMERYILTASYRTDASSRFGADNRWGAFYSLGGSWIISNESFFNARAIDQLALRASYGTTGNANIGNYDASGLYSFTSNYIGVPASFPSRVPNPNLTWEVAHTINLGLDLDIMDRINIALDLYHRKNTDLLQNVQLPGTSGIPSRIQNVGSVQNRGIEFQISTTNIRRADFLWRTDFTISTNQNRVLELYNGEPIERSGNRRLMEGHDMNTLWMRKWHGVNPQTGAPQWEVVTRNEQGEIINVDITEDYGTANNQIVGTTTPNFQGGFRNVIQYRNFTFNAFFTFVEGATGYYGTGISFGAYMTNNFRHLRPGESYWMKPGDDAHFPQNIVNGNNSGHLESSLFLYDRSYLRLRSARLSYAIPENLLQSVGMRSASLYVNGENLLTFTNWPGRDPAASNDYPLARKFLFGIELGF